MIPRYFVGAVLAALLIVGIEVARADTVDLSWQQCAPIVSVRGITNEPVERLYVSGVDLPEFLRGWSVMWSVDAGIDGLPDAWRFDAVGCERSIGPSIIVTSIIPPLALAKTCPSVFPTGESPIFIDQFTLGFLEFGLPATVGVEWLRVSLPSGANPSPGVRHLLGEFLIDFTFAQNGAGDFKHCGGWERPVCLQLIPAGTVWVDETLIDRPLTIGNGTVAYRSPPACGLVPAQPTTWGQIKGQYR